jgi:glycosyltransferase involved in cell wall biosynthesis
MLVIYDDQIFGWQQYGGISRYIVELAKSLTVKSDIDVKVLAPLHFNDYLLAASSTVNVFGCYVDAPAQFRRLIRNVNPIISSFALGLSKPDIVHETWYYKSKNIFPDCNTVITVHDMVNEKFPQYFASDNETARLKSQAVKRADHVICVSENTRKDLLELVDIDPDKTSVVYHGFTLSKSVSDLQAVSSSIHRPYLLYVGSREGYKNFFELVRAYASSPILSREFRLVCFGGGRFTSAEKGYMVKLGLSDFQVQQISGDDQLLATHYKNAAALVYPSKYEGFGIPPLEAMSFNCPVVCSAISSIPEVVGDAGEYFNPDDIGSMQDAICKVVLSPSRGQELMALGMSRLNYFSWEKCASETLNIYMKTSGKS